MTCLHNWLWQLSDMIPNHKKMLQVLLEKACRWEVDLGQVPKSCAKGALITNSWQPSALTKNVTQQAKATTKIKKYETKTTYLIFLPSPH